MTTAQMVQVLNIPSKAMLPGMLIMILIAMLHVRSTNVAVRYRHKYNLEDLIKAQAEFYPHLRPLLKVNVQKEPLKHGDWRIKLTEIEFAVRHRLLRDGAGEVIGREDYEHRAASFDAQRAREVYVKQLGKRWTDSLDDLLPHERAMFGLLAAMICQERETAMEAAAQLSTTWRKVAPRNAPHYYVVTTTKAEAAARKFWDDPRVRKLRRSHGYFHSLMMGMSAAKSAAGELACSHYIWLRPTDQRLFLAIQQTGLPSPHMETAAAFAHYQTELRARMALTEPAVDKAVWGLRTMLVEHGWLVAGDGSGVDWTGKAPTGYGAKRRTGLVK